jgi:hypothetical protein
LSGEPPLDILSGMSSHVDQFWGTYTGVDIRRKLIRSHEINRMGCTGPDWSNHGYIYPVDKQNYHLYANIYTYSYRVAILGMKPTVYGLLNKYLIDSDSSYQSQDIRTLVKFIKRIHCIQSLNNRGLGFNL